MVPNNRRTSGTQFDESNVVGLKKQQTGIQHDTYSHHTVWPDGCQPCRVRLLAHELKAKLFPVVILLMGLALCTPAVAQTPPWSDPKIPSEIARALEWNSKLELVDRAFDRVAYYPWPGFATKDGGSATGLAETLGNGERVAHIATEGRSNWSIADTLVDLAQKMGPRPEDMVWPAPEGEARSKDFQWANPKIPRRLARVLQTRGQLDFVDRAFDRVMYYPWTGFDTKDGGRNLLGRWKTLENGETVAYIATRGRTYGDVANSLIYLAEKMGPRRRENEEHSAIPQTPGVRFEQWLSSNPLWERILLGAILLAAIIMLPFALSAVFNDNSGRASDPIQVSQGNITVERTGLPITRMEPSPGPLERVTSPPVLDFNQMLTDLDRINNAWWPTSKADAIVKRVNEKTRALEAYKLHYTEATGALQSRWNFEQVKQGITDSQAAQYFKQKRWEVENAELEAQRAEAERKSTEAKEATERSERRRTGSAPAEREDYGI